MKVRIAQAGIAGHGRTILNAVRDAGNLELVSCFDVNAPANQEAAREFGAWAAADFEEMLQDPTVAALVLATPNHLHFEQARKAFAAHKHVFVEKPIATAVADARKMIDLANSTGVTLMVGHNTRRRQVFRRAKALLDEGKIGRIIAAEANLSRPAGLQPGLPAWKADPKTCGLLPMMQLGVHFVDTVQYLLGPVERVSCFAANIAMPNNVLDSAVAVLQLASGIPVALTSSYVSADTYFLRIYGTEGTIHCSSLKLRLELLEQGEYKEAQEEDFGGEGAGSYILQMREFGECVLKGLKPETAGGEGLQALAVVEAMARSAETYAVVEVRAVLK